MPNHNKRPRSCLRAKRNATHFCMIHQYYAVGVTSCVKCVHTGYFDLSKQAMARAIRAIFVMLCVKAANLGREIQPSS